MTNKQVIDQHLSSGKLDTSVRRVQRGLGDAIGNSKSTPDPEKNEGGEENNGGHNPSIPAPKDNIEPYSCTSTTCKECFKDQKCIWSNVDKSCTHNEESVLGRSMTTKFVPSHYCMDILLHTHFMSYLICFNVNVPDRQCPTDGLGMLGVKFFHIVGYFSFVLLLVGVYFYRRNACKRDSLVSSTSPVQQQYTTLGQRDDGWDNWEDEEAQTESGMFAAYR